MENKLKTAVVAGGCFWCVEAVFELVKGVEKVVSGYAGGRKETANYRAVCSGNTDHAEVVEITYDPAVIDLEELYKIFFTTHDPTTLNRQGNDRGTQYRSAIFYKDAEEKAIAEKVMQDYAPQIWDDPIVTTLEPLEELFAGEKYHQNYYQRTGDANPYCTVVITPKVAKFRQKFAHRLKKANA